MPPFLDVLKKFEEYADSKRPFAATSLLNGVLGGITDPAALGFARYNLGCLYRGAIGDGVTARSSFIAVNEIFAGLGTLPDHIKQFWPNACENLMLLSLSYDEYDKWAGEVRRLAPSADILRGQVPQIVAMRERGLPWHEAMEEIARGYYSLSNPQRDHQMYGDAASLYHLILTHRKELRVDRQGWTRAIDEYVNLTQRLGADTAAQARRLNPLLDLREFVPMCVAPFSLMDEYLSANVGHAGVMKLRDNMRTWAKALTEGPPRELVFEKRGAPDAGRAPVDVSLRMRCSECGHQLEGPAASCPKCGHKLIRVWFVLLKFAGVGVAAGAGIRFFFSSAPVWVAPVVALALATIELMAGFAHEITRQQALGGTPSTKSVAVERQERIDEMLGTRRTREILCRNGHKMRTFEDEGVLLTACPECGIVKSLPGTMARMTDINRVAWHYEKFEF